MSKQLVIRGTRVQKTKTKYNLSNLMRVALFLHLPAIVATFIEGVKPEECQKIFQVALN